MDGVALPYGSHAYELRRRIFHAENEHNAIHDRISFLKRMMVKESAPFHFINMCKNSKSVVRVSRSVNKSKSLANSNGLFAFVSVEYLLHGLYII